jgi:hypothetical protein
MEPQRNHDLADRGLLALQLVMSFLVWRLFDEEKFLAENLPGYSEYQKQVHLCRTTSESCGNPASLRPAVREPLC